MGIVRLAQSSPPSKTTFKRLLVILQNLVHIEYDNENYGYDDFNGNNGGDYDGPNDPKPDKYHGIIVKIYIQALFPGKKGPLV